MATKIKEYKDFYLGNATDIWKTLPPIIGIAGPFPVLYTDLDSNEIPKPHPGDKLWSRLTWDINIAVPTNIKQTTWRVDASLYMQIFGSTRLNITNSRVEQAGLYMQDKLNSLNNPDIMVMAGYYSRRNQDGGYYGGLVTMNYIWYERRSKNE
ncbi:MAG TPA: hypothetical protein PK745_00045 [bacterium]|nr:hypothetical protein [bacterium]